MRVLKSLLGNARLLSVLLATVALGSCGGSNATGPSGNDLFFSFKMNGTMVEYTDAAALWATFNTTTGQSSLIIVGFDGSTGAGLQVWRDQAVTTGTYSGFTAVNNAIVGVVMYYDDATNTNFAADPVVPADATIVITSITATRVSGTFFGVLKAQGQPDITVTEGKFTVQRTN
jgi:hypothetical protein